MDRWAAVRHAYYASFVVSARRDSRRAAVTGMPRQRASPPCPSWHQDAHCGGSVRHWRVDTVATLRLPSRTVAAGPKCGAHVAVRYAADNNCPTGYGHSEPAVLVHSETAAIGRLNSACRASRHCAGMDGVVLISAAFPDQQKDR